MRDGLFILKTQKVSDIMSRTAYVKLDLLSILEQKEHQASSET